MVDDTKSFPETTIETTEENFDYWINQDFISDELKEQLSKANLLLIPHIECQNIDILNFPVKTMDFFEFLEENKKDGLEPNICIEDKDYKELALHNDWIIITDVIVRDVVLPLYLGLLGNYLYSIWKDKTKEKRVIFKMTVVRKKSKIKIKYDGPADSFIENVIKEIQMIKDE